MDHKVIIQKTENYVKETLTGDSSGHDWWHVYRVWQMAKHIAKQENVNMFIVEIGALLHDIADYKMHNGDEEIGPQTARIWLESLKIKEEDIAHVCEIIRHISFKGAQVVTKMETREGMIVQDADRLDALGAIGIARTFAYGGHAGREMYNPEKKPVMHVSFAAYKKSDNPTLNHFYEKLFLLEERMNTPMAKKIAHERTQYMKDYVEKFYREWDGKE